MRISILAASTLALLGALAAVAIAAEGPNAPTGKPRDRATCEKIVRGNRLYQRPGGGLTENAETSIGKCMRGEQFPLVTNVDPNMPPRPAR
jgi:hypothetical protein